MEDNVFSVNKKEYEFKKYIVSPIVRGVTPKHLQLLEDFQRISERPNFRDDFRSGGKTWDWQVYQKSSERSRMSSRYSTWKEAESDRNRAIEKARSEGYDIVELAEGEPGWENSSPAGDKAADKTSASGSATADDSEWRRKYEARKANEQRTDQQKVEELSTTASKENDEWKRKLEERRKQEEAQNKQASQQMASKTSDENDEWKRKLEERRKQQAGQQEQKKSSQTVFVPYPALVGKNQWGPPVFVPGTGQNGMVTIAMKWDQMFKDWPYRDYYFRVKNNAANKAARISVGLALDKGNWASPHTDQGYTLRPGELKNGASFVLKTDEGHEVKGFYVRVEWLD